MVVENFTDMFFNVFDFFLGFIKTLQIAILPCKLSTNFSSTPYTVVAANGSKVLIKDESHSITINLSLFEKHPSDLQSESDEIDDVPASTQNKRNNDK